MIGRLSILLFFPIFLAAPHSFSTTPTPQPDLTTIKELSRQYWESISYLHLTSSDSFLLSSGLPDQSLPSLQLFYLIAPSNKRAVQISRRDPGKLQVVEYNSREDGQKGYALAPFLGHPQSISTLAISYQKSDATRYLGPMTGILWLLIPGGRPLYCQLDDATIESIDPTGDIQLLIHHNSKRYHCILAANRDFQPRRVWFDNHLEYEVTRFERHQGHWFPMEGKYTNRFRNQGKKWMSFQVTELKVNQPIPDARFGPPAIPDGVAIQDTTASDPKKTNYPKGGMAARGRLAKQYSLPTPLRPTPPITALPTLSPTRWFAVFAGLSFALAILVYVVRNR